ncbi:MAG: hypothetical protein N4A53_08215 [Pelagimonas sp.]|jgi:hypothetical protein|nr:hypothetical protein [Pelagimonas sp.]
MKLFKQGRIYGLEAVLHDGKHRLHVSVEYDHASQLASDFDELSAQQAPGSRSKTTVGFDLKPTKGGGDE